jgi:hypothetical protein
MKCPFQKCACDKQADAKIQGIRQFTVGSAVGFTDEYHRQFKRCENINFNDWIIAEEANKDGVIVVQRYGMPNTKTSIGRGWVYLK